MTALEATGQTAARALAIAALGLAAGRLVAPLLHRRAPARSFAWTLLLLPLFTPPLAVGYSYAASALALVHHPWLNEIFYVALQTLRLAPAAAVILRLAPAPALSAQAVWTRALLAGPTPSLRDRATIALAYLRGPGRGSVAAAAMLFLLAFQEFEIASLMGVASWTIRLFDAQSRGLPLGDSLGDAALAAAFQALPLLPVMLLLTQAGDPRPGHAAPPRRPRAGVALVAWIYLALATAAVAFIPLGILLSSAWTGFRSIREQFAFAAELRASFFFALAASLVAMLLAAAAARVTRTAPSPALGPTPSPSRSRWARAIQAAMVVPGLLGSLIVALAVQAAFQLPGLGALYDTPLPLLLAMVLTLLAPAVLVFWLLGAGRDAQALHAAAMLLRSASPQPRASGRRVIWDLAVRPRLWAGFLLFCWSFLELTAASLLAPSGLRPASVMLYNLMHFGRNAVLSAMVCIAVAVPVMLLASLLTGRAWACRLIQVRR